MSETELAEQGEVVRGFLVDLLDAFGLEGDVTATPAEDAAVELEVAGDDLGLLIGPKGDTLQAVQELSRSVLQRTLPGRGPRPHPGGRRWLPGPSTGGPRGLHPQGRRRRGRLRRAEGARADGPARPQGRPRHRERHRRCPHGLRGRGRPDVGSSSSPTEALCSGRRFAPRPPHAAGDRRSRLELRAGGLGPRPATDLRRRCSSSWSEPAALGVPGPGPVEPHIDHARCSSPRWRRSRGRWSTSAAAAASGLVLAVARPDLPSSSSTPAPSAAASSRRPRGPRPRGRGHRGTGRGDRAHGSAGSGRRGRGPQLRRRRRPPPSAAAPCCGSVDGSWSASRPRPRIPIGGPPPGYVVSGSRRPCEWSTAPPSRCSSSAPRARTPTPAGTASPPSSPCSDASGVFHVEHRRPRCGSRGREFHVEHRERSLHRPTPPGRMQQ